jgi:hypothetical protein
MKKKTESDETTPDARSAEDSANTSADLNVVAPLPRPSQQQALPQPRGEARVEKSHGSYRCCGMCADCANHHEST